MTKQIKLQAKARTLEEGKASKIRNENFIPAVLYGPNIKSRNIKIKKLEFEKTFETAGESSLIDLEIDAEAPVKVLIKDTQVNPIKNQIIHADLYEVDMKKKITTEIPLHFMGEAPAVKELGAILVKDIDSLEVECLPGDLVSHIEVDLSVLKNFHDAIKTNDLKIPAGLKLVNETNDMVASVMEMKVEVEEVKAPVEGEVPAEGTTPVEGEAGKDTKKGKETETKEKTKGSK